MSENLDFVRSICTAWERGQMQAKVASLFHIRGAQVTRLVNYLDSDRALADLGVAG
jgi:hypothetical protein